MPSTWSSTRSRGCRRPGTQRGRPAVAILTQLNMQTFDFSEGGYIIPAYVDALDAYSTKIAGFRPARIGQPLSDFDMEHWYFT